MLSEDEKTYDFYLTVAKLAGNNIRRAISNANGMSDISFIIVKINGRKYVADLTGNIMAYTGRNAVSTYKTKANSVIKTETNGVVLSHFVDNGKAFVESVVHSREARNCQRILINYLMAERYFNEAYNFDVTHNDNKMSAVKKAKIILENKYSLSFLSGFFFDEACPKLDAQLKENLYKRAFDLRYSYATLDSTLKLAQNKYLQDFSSRNDDFLMSVDEIRRRFKAENISSRVTGQTDTTVNKSMLKAVNRSAKPANSIDLYKSAFVKLPTRKRKRAFRNLKWVNKDIFLCRPGTLDSKNGYAEIEEDNKHSFIINYYKRLFEKQESSDSNEKRFLYNCECKMYRHIWHTQERISYTQGFLYFPDGAVAKVNFDNNETAYDVLHRINCIYAALFGFTPDDKTSPTDWMYDSIRSAYTDEGIAMYRKAMIKARRQGRI